MRKVINKRDAEPTFIEIGDTLVRPDNIIFARVNKNCDEIFIRIYCEANASAVTTCKDKNHADAILDNLVIYPCFVRVCDTVINARKIKTVSLENDTLSTNPKYDIRIETCEDTVYLEFSDKSDRDVAYRELVEKIQKFEEMN